MQLLLAALWLATASAAPNDPVAPSSAPEPQPDPGAECRSDPPDRTRPFGAELERAKELYRRGCHAWALDLLRDLDVRRRIEPVDTNVAIDARLYLGEVQYVTGARADARATFEALLVEHPVLSMGLFEHDPDAVDLFNVVKASLSAQTAPPPPIDVPPRPIWTYLPYGVAHLHNKDRDRAFGWAAGQLICGSAALGTYVYIRVRWPVRSNDPAEYARRLPVYVANWSSNVCFAGLYVGSQIDATRRYRARFRARARITVLPDGALLTADGRF